MAGAHAFSARLAAMFLVACCVLAVAPPAPANVVEDLRALDRRADGSAVLGMAVFDEPREMPRTVFVDESGAERNVSEYRGSFVALHFWATWCYPCREEMPVMDALQRELGDELVVLPLSVDRGGADIVRAFYEDHGLRTMPVLITGLKTARALRVNGIPHTIFLDDAGRAIAQVAGSREWNDPEVVALLRRMAGYARATP